MDRKQLAPFISDTIVASAFLPFVLFYIDTRYHEIGKYIFLSALPYFILLVIYHFLFQNIKDSKRFLLYLPVCLFVPGDLFYYMLPWL